MFLHNPYRSRAQVQSQPNGQPDTSSVASLLTEDKLQHLDDIRPSHTIGREKEVVLLTPVLIGNSNLATEYQPTRQAYRLGDRINDLAPPSIEMAHAGGLIVEMPLEQVEPYLQRVLSLNALVPDE